uniref:Uncharacterized protein n=1 Tax=Glossina morsitans morsitans TaxID=37546 RepID=A0A1B0G842_GLOMM
MSSIRTLLTVTAIVLTIEATVMEMEILVELKDSGSSEISIIENYLNAYRRQNMKNIEKYDATFDKFATLYENQLQTIQMQNDLLKDHMQQTEDELDLLELISEMNKLCVRKYRNYIPVISVAVEGITTCITKAKERLTTALATPKQIRDNLQAYYKSTFESNIRNCYKTKNESSLFCITQEVTNSRGFTNSNKHKFDTEMDVALFQANGQVKTASDCSFQIYYNSTTATADVKSNIGRCLQILGGERNSSSEFALKSEDSTCDNIQAVTANAFDFSTISVPNTLYRSNRTVNCLLLKVV